MVEQLTAATASEFDFVVAIDGSGSMQMPVSSTNAKTRWLQAQESTFGIAAYLEKIDSDGIDVVLFGGSVESFEGVTSQKVIEIFATRSPRGGTPLDQAISWAYNKQQRTGKNTVMIVFTDGEPSDQSAVQTLITNIGNTVSKDEAFTILFVQIGDDQAAAAYLAKLDDQLQTKFDIVSSISQPEADSMEPLQLITRAINN